MNITPDQWVIWQYGFVTLNATIVFTWLVMALLAIGARLITRRLSTDTTLPRWQNMLEAVVELIQGQISEVSQQSAQRYLPFIGTLFLFIFVSNVLSIVPGFQPPTGSLSTTAALALCVFVAVPIYGIAQRGLVGYLTHYLRPTPLMLPFNIIGELSRTLALAVRLFGNMMSGSILVAIIVSIVPLFFPVLLQILGLISGVIQAYIFAMLAMIYIASATRIQQTRDEEQEPQRQSA